MRCENVVNRTDSVVWCNDQIERWKGWLARNEQEKVDAHKNRVNTLIQNISFDAGASVNHTTELDTIKTNTYECTVVGQVLAGGTTGQMFNKLGVIGTIRTVTGGGTHKTNK